MLKITIIAIALLSCAANTTQTNMNLPASTVNTATQQQPTSIHQFTVPALDGTTINFANFKGKKILIVNTASECGFTKQYEGLEQLYKQYKEKIVVVGFPANNFGGQEPGSNTEIQSFCKKNYGVTFPMAAKISVNGDDAAAIYKWLCNKSQNGVLDATIKWNFNKFLLDENGIVLQYFESSVAPLSEKITSKL